MTDSLVWVDCEMTGLNPAVDALVEVAVVVTDYDLTLVDPGLSVVIKPPSKALEQMSDFVREMHASSGLLDDIPQGVAVSEAEEMVFEYISRFVPQAGVAPLAGNSIGTDRVFLAQEMPTVHQHLHYRNVDVSTIKELVKHWLPPVYFNAPEKNGGHRALADILESIRELQYYRKASFVADVSGSSDHLKKLSAELVEAWKKAL